MHLGVVSARLLVSCTYGFGVVRRTYEALRWKTHGDRGADANLALHVEGTAVQFDKGFDQRQAKAGPFIFAVEVAVDLLEGVGTQSWYLAELGTRVAGANNSFPRPYRQIVAGLVGGRRDRLRWRDECRGYNNSALRA